MAKNTRRNGDEDGGALAVAEQPVAPRTVAGALAAEAGEDAAMWRGLYSAAVLELAGKRVDGAEVLAMLRVLRVPDEQAAARWDAIKGEVRERLADLAQAVRFDELQRQREAARAHAADLAQRVPLEIARLHADLKESKAAHRRAVVVWGAAERAKERLERSVPPFLQPIRDRVAAAATQARAEIVSVRACIDELRGVAEHSLSAAKSIREEVGPDERFRDKDSVPPLWHSRAYMLEAIADRVGLVTEPIRRGVARGFEARETQNQARRGTAAIDRGFILDGLAAHHEEVAAEANRLRVILEGRMVETERAVAACEAEERRVAEEITSWWTKQAESAKPTR